MSYSYKPLKDITSLIVGLNGWVGLWFLFQTVMGVWFGVLVTRFVYTETAALGEKVKSFSHLFAWLFSTNPLWFIIMTIVIFHIILFFIWIHQANHNCQALHPQDQFEFTPGFAVGSFFIPFLNLIWGYQVIREIWQKSAIDGRNSFIVPLWWFFTISPLLLHLLATFILVSYLDTKEGALARMWLEIAGVFFYALSDFLFIFIAINVTRKQTATFQLQNEAKPVTQVETLNSL